VADEDEESSTAESDDGRLDRELIELLNELRVALPGVQVLFAFLLTVPFTNRFANVSDRQRDAYLLALIAAAIGSVLFIAPTAHHRIRFRQHDKAALLRTANTLALAGTVALAIGMTAAVFFVTDFLFADTVTTLVTALVAGCFVWLWYGLPLLRKARD
jgi:hypothetical protein